MGVIFTPEQIMAKQIPSDGAHEIAGQNILDRLFREAELGEESSIEDLFCIRSGMIYGSTALGTANRRSDIDVLIRYEAAFPNAAYDRVRRVVSDVENQFHTPVEARLIPAGSLPPFIDKLFLGHLLRIQEDERWTCNWPLEHEFENNLSVPDIYAVAKQYCDYKVNSFGRRLSDFRGEVHYKAMQRALELPNALGRKIIAASLQTADVDSVATGNKMSTISQVSHYTSDAEHRYKLFNVGLTSLGRLSELDREYDTELTMAINGTHTITHYRRWLQEQYVLALQSALALANFWSEVLSRDFAQLKYSIKEPQTVDLYLPGLGDGELDESCYIGELY